MATIRQYFETDFDYALRVKVKYELEDQFYEGAVFYDANANSAFVAFIFPVPPTVSTALWRFSSR